MDDTNCGYGYGYGRAVQKLFSKLLRVNVKNVGSTNLRHAHSREILLLTKTDRQTDRQTDGYTINTETVNIAK